MRNLEQKRGKEDCSPPDEYTLLPRTSYHEEDLCPPAVPFLQGTVSKTPGLFSTEVPRPALSTTASQYTSPVPAPIEACYALCISKTDGRQAKILERGKHTAAAVAQPTQRSLLTIPSDLHICKAVCKCTKYTAFVTQFYTAKHTQYIN